MKAANMTCDNVCQFAVNIFSMEPISFIPSVDIGTAAFLKCCWLSLRINGGREAPRLRAINHVRVKMSIPVGAVRRVRAVPQRGKIGAGRVAEWFKAPVLKT
jgi:hypothetical protein